MDQLNIFLKVLIFAFAAILLCIAIAAGYIEKKTLSFTAGALSILLIAFGYFGNLKKISLSPSNVEAEFHQAINEAYATIDQMRNLAVVSSKSILTDIMAGSFMGSMNQETRLNLHDQLISNLQKMGVPPEDMKEAEEMWTKGIRLIYHRAIVNELGKENAEASKLLRNMSVFDEWKAPSPDKIEAFINEKGLMTESLSAWISDYRNFIDTGNIRRRELFVLQ